MILQKPILDVLGGASLSPAPIWFMRQAGRHLPEYMQLRAKAKNFIDFCFNPEMAAEATLQPVRRYGVDAAILFADILLIPKALGRRVDFIKGKGPDLDGIKVDEIAQLQMDGVSDRLSNIYQTVRQVKSQLDDRVALIGFCGGPWTVATYMIEGGGSANKEIAKRFAYEQPVAMKALLETLADASAEYLIGQARAGADVLKIFESWAENMPPELFKSCIITPTQRLIKRVRDGGVDRPIIGFPRGAGFNIIPYREALPIDCLAIGTDTDLQQIRHQVGDKLPLQGNLDPLALRIGGDVLERAVEQVLSSIKGPHIFNLGHGVAPDVKIENMHAVIRHVRTGEANYV